MAVRLPLGSELWLLFYDNEGPRYVPRCVGKIERIGPLGYYAGGRWRAANTYPMFGNEADAKAHAETHQPSMPAITEANAAH